MNKNNDIVYIATPLKENVALVKELKKLVWKKFVVGDEIFSKKQAKKSVDND
jgi:hypothetical protein